MTTMLFTDPRMRSPSALGDASDKAAMDSVLSTLQQDYADAWNARGTSFLLVNGADIDTTLSNYGNMLSYLSGDGYQRVLSGDLKFSTGDSDAPGWLETAQGIEDGLASTVGVISRTNFSSLAKSAGAQLPSSFPWWGYAILATVSVVAFAYATGQAATIAKLFKSPPRRTAGYRRRKR